MKKLILICVSIFLFSNLCFASGISSTASSADCDNETLSTYGGTTNLQANWGPNKINLYWYDGNTLLEVQDSADSCFYDGPLTIPDTPPTKTGYTFDGWRVRGLPEGYTKLEYIESTGTQYIDTGINESNRAVFSMNAKAKSNDTVVFIISNSDSSGYTEGFGEYYDSVAGFSQLKATGNHYYDLTYSSSGISFIYDNDGQVHETGTYKINNNKRIYLFGISASGYDRHISAKLYYLRLYNNDLLVRNFIPAKDSNNVVGLYDMVTQTFFTNSGTGSFVAGPNVR